MSSINKKNKAKNSYVFRNKSLVEKKLKIKRLYFFNSCMRRLLKEQLRYEKITNTPLVNKRFPTLTSRDTP